MKSILKRTLFQSTNIRVSTKLRWHQSFSTIDAVTETTETEEEVASPNVKPRRKFNKMKGNRPILIEQNERNSILEAKAVALGLPWRIIASSILQRYPTVLKEAEPWEQEHIDLQEKLDDLKRQEFMDAIKDTEAMVIAEQNPSYDEILETLPFTPAPRVTEADLNNDRHSLDRKLPDNLFFVVKRNRDSYGWQFPQGKLKEGETARAGAERVIDRAVGKIERWFISNAPIGHYCYEYSAEEQAQRKEFGAKVFFYRCQIIGGNVRLETRLYKDFAWIGRDEVEEYFPSEMCHLLKSIIPLD